MMGGTWFARVAEIAWYGDPLIRNDSCVLPPGEGDVVTNVATEGGVEGKKVAVPSLSHAVA